MKEIKKFEKKLYHFIGKADHNEQSVINAFLDFWEHYDTLFRTNHYTVIMALSSTDAKHFTLEGLALRLNMSDRTLLRYRKLYIRSFAALYEKSGITTPFAD